MNWEELLPEAVAAGCGARPVTGVTADSRAVDPGVLFFALRGSQADGHHFIGEAVAAGAVGVVAERKVAVPPETALAVHSEARKLLGQAAARLFGHPARTLPVVGVTGTNGKTTLSWLVAHLFDDGAVVGTLGWGRPGALEPAAETTPGAVALQERLASLREAGVSGVAVEASSHGLDQERLAGLPLTGAVWTNLSPEHLDYHGDLAAYGAAKARLLGRPGLRFAVLNAEDPAVEAYAGTLAPGVALWRFGEVRGDVRAQEVCCAPDGVRLRAATPAGPVSVRSPLAGRVNVANLLAAIATGLALGLDTAAIAERLGAAPPVPGRMEDLGETARGARVWVDFAHTADALERTLAGARELVEGSLWCLFGCGGERDPRKRAAMGAVADRLCDRVVLTSDNPRGEDPEAIITAVAGGMLRLVPDRIPEREDAIAQVLAAAGPGDGVVLAGKGHEQHQEVAGRRLPFSDRSVAARWLAPAAEAVTDDDPG